MASSDTRRTIGSVVALRDNLSDLIIQYERLIGHFEKWHRESSRVRLAVLKLAHGSVEKLRVDFVGAD